MRRSFVSAGWPYLYDVPGLHNCIPMLFADSVARHRRLRGGDVAFVSGADEHGSRVEFVAEGLGRTPRALLDEKVGLTRPLLTELGLSLDLFARTTDPAHQQFVTRFFERLIERGAVERRAARVPFCPTCQKHLPDRFVEGLCPKCANPAFGNQCNDKRRCGALLDPSELDSARCAVCSGDVELREREHLFLPIAEHAAPLRRHIEASYADAPAVRSRALATLEGTAGAMLTRDTAWGVPLPSNAALPDRTVYSWVDSLLGKVSAVEALGKGDALWREPGTEKVFFLGADGVAFYSVLFPALLMAAGQGHALDGWRIVTNDVLIYEGGICSKSSRNSIGLTESLALLPGDYWRFAVFDAEAQAARSGVAAGSADLDFRWDAFARAATEKLGAIREVYGSLAGRVPKPDPDAPAIRAIEGDLDALRPGAAFGRLLDLLVGGEAASRPEVAAAALPLLECFLPDAAARAERLLLGIGCARLFPELPLDGAALRAQYVRTVGERRSSLDLEAELLDVRADALCVCPTRLGEA